MIDPEAKQQKSYREVHQSLEAAETGGNWLEHLRVRAFRRFQTLGFPTRRLEAWKYLRLEPILDARYELPHEDCLEAIDEKMLEPFFLGRREKHRLAFVNGIYSRKFSLTKDLPGGVILEDLFPVVGSPRERLFKPYLAKNIEEDPDAFAAINTFHFTDGGFLRVPENVVMDAPVHFLFVSVDPNARAYGHTPLVFYPRMLVVLEEGARANVVVNHIDLTKGRHFMNAVAEAHIDSHADLKYTGARRGNGNGFHFSAARFFLKENSRLDAVFFGAGGGISRQEAAVDFEGEGAFASLKGLSVMRGDSQIFNHAVANHRAARCTSRQFYKSILSDRAKSEFNSMVFVEKDAVQSDSNQMSRHLLLSDFAQGYARPQLRIHTDDVSCVHGATVGQLEEAELFYLRSRGLSREEARRLLIYGFAKEILDGLPDEGLRLQLDQVLRGELETLAKG